MVSKPMTYPIPIKCIIKTLNGLDQFNQFFVPIYYLHDQFIKQSNNAPIKKIIKISWWSQSKL